LNIRYGQIGCILSHLKAVTEAKESGLEYVLILEDDAVLVEGFKKKLSAALHELPEDWEALWLNGTETKKGRSFSPYIKTVRAMWGTFGYLLNSSFYDTVIEGLSKEIKSADGFYTSIQSKSRVYATKIPLVKHRVGWSDISETVESRYKHLA